MLEYALRLDELAAQIRAGQRSGFGSAESQEQRAAELRRMAKRELTG